MVDKQWLSWLPCNVKSENLKKLLSFKVNSDFFMKFSPIIARQS